MNCIADCLEDFTVVDMWLYKGVHPVGVSGLTSEVEGVKVISLWNGICFIIFNFIPVQDEGCTTEVPCMKKECFFLAKKPSQLVSRHAIYGFLGHKYSWKRAIFLY